MANNWNIPDWLEKEVRERDTKCVYCGTDFTSAKVARKTAASWEHIINDASIVTRENIALCCCGCNSSKGQKQLLVWLESKYYQDLGISSKSVAPIIKEAIAAEQEQHALLEGLERGERAVLEGKTYSQSDAKARMSKWLN